jgi:hypothetical protein
VTDVGRVDLPWKSKLRPKTCVPFSVWGSDPSSSLEFKYYFDRYPEGLHNKLS